MAVLLWCRNIQLGKFMTYVNIYDSDGIRLANSSRPVVLPYEAPSTLFLTSLLRFPWAFVGLLDPSEQYTINVQLINNFIEPTSGYPPTETIELSLSTNEIDVADAHLTVMPLLTGFT